MKWGLPLPSRSLRKQTAAPIRWPHPLERPATRGHARPGPRPVESSASSIARARNITITVKRYRGDAPADWAAKVCSREQSLARRGGRPRPDSRGPRASRPPRSAGRARSFRSASSRIRNERRHRASNSGGGCRWTGAQSRVAPRPAGSSGPAPAWGNDAGAGWRDRLDPLEGRIEVRAELGERVVIADRAKSPRGCCPRRRPARPNRHRTADRLESQPRGWWVGTPGCSA